MRGVNDVVQKTHCQLNHAFQLVPGDAAAGSGFHASGIVKAGQVDRTEVTGFKRQQRLFAAGIGAFDLALGGRRVVTVDPIQEHNARIARKPGPADQQIKHIPRTQPAVLGTRVRRNQRVILIALHRFHERFCYPYRKIEIIEFAIFFFCTDKFQNVRVINAQNAHVGPAPCAPLLDLFRSRVENAHERHRA